MHVATDPGFTNLVYSGTTFSTTAAVPVLEGWYYWRVIPHVYLNPQPSFKDGRSNSSHFYITPVPTLSYPQQISPANGATLSSTQVTLQWNWQAYAVDYGLRVFTDPNNPSGTAIFDRKLGSTATSYALTAPADGRRYYWQVFAYNVEGTWWRSDSWSFITPVPPPAPTLVSPLSSASGSTVQFRWNAAAGATSYTLQVSKSSSFSTSILNSNVGNVTSYSASGLPDNDSTVYWRVTANSGGGSTVSTTAQFTNAASTPPLAPVTTAPLNGATVTGAGVIFKWNASARATKYTLQIANEQNFNAFSRYPDQVVITTSSARYDLPLNGGALYWRVFASNSAGPSPYSNAPSAISFYNNTCAAVATGTGIGVLGDNKLHVDTCGKVGSSYFLKDISRRQGYSTLTGHNHGGAMSFDAAILTKALSLSNPVLQKSTNTWNAGGQEAAAVDAHVYTGRVYDYFKFRFGINGYDNTGRNMVNVIGVSSFANGDPCQNNAFWSTDIDSGGEGMRICDVTLGERYRSAALDVVAHEWAHAVTEKLGADLTYAGESGALNEAFSDWVGLAVEYANTDIYPKGPNSTIGEAYAFPGVRPSRNMENPHLSNPPQPHSYPVSSTTPAYWKDPNCLFPSSGNDYCGVHTNSGVPNKMFTLLAFGGQHNWISVGGIGLERAIKIAFYANKALRNSPYPVNFSRFRQAMVDAAASSPSSSPYEMEQVKNAWYAVRVGAPSPWYIPSFLSAVPGSTSPAAEAINIAPDNPAASNWQISADVPWLSFSSSQGSGAASINLLANSGGLVTGSYSGTITVTLRDNITGAIVSSYVSPITLVVRQPPSGLSVADVPNDDGGVLKLSWAPSSDSTVTQQRIYRADQASGPYNLVETIADRVTSSYLDNGLDNYKRYYYQVRGFDGKQETVPSNSADALVLDRLPWLPGIMQMILD